MDAQPRWLHRSSGLDFSSTGEGGAYMDEHGLLKGWSDTNICFLFHHRFGRHKEATKSHADSIQPLVVFRPQTLLKANDFTSQALLNFTITDATRSGRITISMFTYYLVSTFHPPLMTYMASSLPESRSACSKTTAAHPYKDSARKSSSASAKPTCSPPA